MSTTVQAACSRQRSQTRAIAAGGSSRHRPERPSPGSTETVGPNGTSRPAKDSRSRCEREARRAAVARAAEPSGRDSACARHGASVSASTRIVGPAPVSPVASDAATVLRPGAPWGPHTTTMRPRSLRSPERSSVAVGGTGATAEGPAGGYPAPPGALVPAAPGRSLCSWGPSPVPSEAVRPGTPARRAPSSAAAVPGSWRLRACSMARTWEGAASAPSTCHPGTDQPSASWVSMSRMPRAPARLRRSRTVRSTSSSSALTTARRPSPASAALSSSATSPQRRTTTSPVPAASIARTCPESSPVRASRTPVVLALLMTTARWERGRASCPPPRR